MRKQLCLCLLSSAAVFAPARAYAEDEPKPYPECTRAPSDAETAAAKGAYQAGNASFDEADYPRAITYWEDAYRRDCTANLLLKNLARAYELYGQKRQAVVALETFLVREPTSSDKDQIQRRIEVLRKQIAAEKAAPVPVEPTPPSVTPATTVSSAGVEPEPAPTAHTGKRPIFPLVVAGVGAVALVVGVAVYVPAAKDVKDSKNQCPLNSETGKYDCGALNTAIADKANRADKKKTAGAVVAGIGAVGLVGGLIWYFVQPRSAEATGSVSKPRVSTSLTPGFAGLSLSGAF